MIAEWWVKAVACESSRHAMTLEDLGRAQNRSWAVVGGGVLGMSVALRLAEAGNDVTLFEAADHLGGLAAPWTLGDITWDRHYHVTLLSDTRTRAMFASIGIGEAEMRWVETRTGYYGADAMLRSVSNIFEFMQLPGLSLLDKLRLGGTIVLGSKIRDGGRMERVGVERWLRRWSGDSAFEAFWRPLLRAKLGDAYRTTSAAFIWSTIRRLYAARRSGLKREMFGYVSGGYARVCAAFADTLTEAGVTLRLSQGVRSVTKAADHGLSVRMADSEARFDGVVITTSAPLAARMCPDLLEGERRRLEDVQYVGLICVSLVLRNALADYYLTYITDPQAPFTAVVEMTAFIDPDEVDGLSLVYLPKYTTRDDPLFAMNDDGIVGAFLPYLRQMYPMFSDHDLVTARVSRVEQIFAVPTLGYSMSAPSIGTSVHGLVIAGSANLPFATLNVDDTLSLVDQALEAACVIGPDSTMCAGVT